MNIIDVNTIYGAGTDSAFKNTAQNLSDYLKSNGISKGLSLNKYGVLHDFIEGNNITLNEVNGMDTLLPVATINPKGFLGEENIISNIKSNGFKAIKFFPDLQNWSSDNIVFKEILEINKNYNLPIIVNTKKFGDLTLLDEIFNYDFPLICSCISYENLSEFIAFAKKSNVYIETSNFKNYVVLEKVIDKIGIDRVLFGSNSPHDLAKVSIELISKSPISDEYKEKIFSLNASKLF